MFTVQELIIHTSWSLSEAESERSKIIEPILFNNGVSGMTNRKCRHFLNNLCSISGSRYLELGPWLGATSISALYHNSPEVYFLIDDWSIEFPDNASEILNTKFNTILGYSPNIIEDNCFSIDPASKGINNINIFFCDVGSAEDDQYSSISYYSEFMDNNFIYVLNNVSSSFTLDGINNAASDNNLTIEAQWTVPAAIGDNSPNPFYKLYAGVFSKQ
jgi:hypothetical protein